MIQVVSFTIFLHISNGNRSINFLELPEKYGTYKNCHNNDQIRKYPKRYKDSYHELQPDKHPVFIDILSGDLCKLKLSDWNGHCVILS